MLMHHGVVPTADEELRLSVLRELIEQQPASPDRSKAALWALDSLERHLGDGWVQRACAKDTDIRQSLLLCGTHADATILVLQLALRLELLKATPGMGKVRRQLRKDLRYAEVVHGHLQIEVAALARMAQAAVTIEVQLPGASSPVDLAVNLGGQLVPVEARVRLTDEAFRKADEVSTSITMARLALEVKHHVTLRVELDCLPDDVSVVIDLVRAVAETAAAADDLVVRELDGVRVLGARDPAPFTPGFVGPQVTNDYWLRLAGVVAEKAEKRYASRPAWLRVDARHGLWQLTPWANLPFEQKVPLLAEAVQAQLNDYDIAGLVLSSGQLRTAGSPGPDTWLQTSPDVNALRRELAPGLVRETLIVLNDARFQVEADWWCRLYSDEPRWFDTALAEIGLPDLGSVLR